MTDIVPKHDRLAYPRFNLNGTSRETLKLDLHKSWHALTLAADAHQQTFPHGRDYQTVSPREYVLAREQHMRRAALIAHLLEEMEWLLMCTVQQKSLGRDGVEITAPLLRDLSRPS